MKKKINKFAALPFVVLLMGLCMSMTNPISSREIQTVSTSASNDFSMLKQEVSWTWSNFAGSAVVGGASGAAGGAVAGLMACGIGAGPGAAAGAVGGAVSGAVAYAGTQAWDAMFGSSVSVASQTSFSYLEKSLD